MHSKDQLRKTLGRNETIMSMSLRAMCITIVCTALLSIASTQYNLEFTQLAEIHPKVKDLRQYIDTDFEVIRLFAIEFIAFGTPYIYFHLKNRTLIRKIYLEQ